MKEKTHGQYPSTKWTFNEDTSKEELEEVIMALDSRQKHRRKTRVKTGMSTSNSDEVEEPENKDLVKAWLVGSAVLTGLVLLVYGPYWLITTHPGVAMLIVKGIGTIIFGFITLVALPLLIGAGILFEE